MYITSKCITAKQQTLERERERERERESFKLSEEEKRDDQAAQL